MAYNSGWPRWIQASVADHFKTTANSEGFASLVEGLEERTTVFQESTNRLEIRINGPFVRQVSANYYHFDVDVNILILSHMDGTSDSVYRGTNIAGKMAERANEPIPVFKYGGQPEDDQSQIGCLLLKDGSKDGVKVFHFGEINAEDRLRQAGVDCSYNMDICP